MDDMVRCVGWWVDGWMGGWVDGRMGSSLRDRRYITRFVRVSTDIGGACTLSSAGGGVRGATKVPLVSRSICAFLSAAFPGGRGMTCHALVGSAVGDSAAQRRAGCGISNVRDSWRHQCSGLPLRCRISIIAKVFSVYNIAVVLYGSGNMLSGSIRKVKSELIQARGGKCGRPKCRDGEPIFNENSTWPPSLQVAPSCHQGASCRVPYG